MGQAVQFAGGAGPCQRVRSIVQACADRGVRFLTLFAFSTKNWQRPPAEVSSLMALLALYLRKEVNDMNDMNAKGVRLKVVGGTSGFDATIQGLIHDPQKKTAYTITLSRA